MSDNELTLDDFTIGDRVQLHPATDLWMRGARYGRIVGASNIGRSNPPLPYFPNGYVRVQLDRNLQCVNLDPTDIGEIL